MGEGIQFTVTVIGGFIYAFYESWEVSLIILAVVPLMAGSASFMLTVTTKQTERKNQNYTETGKYMSYIIYLYHISLFVYRI
jgi:ATP-binding cassette subfamily B (MDR/TAP) protein 1